MEIDKIQSTVVRVALKNHISNLERLSFDASTFDCYHILRGVIETEIAIAKSVIHKIDCVSNKNQITRMCSGGEKLFDGQIRCAACGKAFPEGTTKICKVI